MPDAEWTPGDVVGFCPECREEFYVPHGGKCPAEHEGDTPDLIEYVPRTRLREVLVGLESDLAKRADELWTDEMNATLRARSQGVTEALDRLRAATHGVIE